MVEELFCKCIIGIHGLIEWRSHGQENGFLLTKVSNQVSALWRTIHQEKEAALADDGIFLNDHSISMLPPLMSPLSMR